MNRNDSYKVKGYRGKWHVIDETYFRGEKVYLLEHDTYGDEVPGLIVYDDLRVLYDEAWDGLENLDDI